MKHLRLIIRTTSKHLQRTIKQIRWKKILKKAVINPTLVKSRKRIPRQDDHTLWLPTRCQKILMSERYRVKRVVKVRKFPGATTDDMYHYLTPLTQKQPGNVFLHVGTNDTSSCDSSKFVDNILKLILFIHMPHFWSRWVK